VGRVVVITGTIPVTINNLTVSNGKAFRGGGINNSGLLTLNNVTVSNNTVILDNNPFSGGAGILNTGTLANTFASQEALIEPI
jgi:hypothetical protein